jgi:hypothetical protein
MTFPLAPALGTFPATVVKFTTILPSKAALVVLKTCVALPEPL